MCSFISKLRSVIIILIILLFSGFSGSCQSVTKVSYFSGSMWGYSKIAITKDSVTGTMVWSNKKIAFKEKTDKKFWNKIVRAISLEEFQKVERRKPTTETDSNVTNMEIETKEQNY